MQKRWKEGVPEFMKELAIMFKKQDSWMAAPLKEAASELITANGQNFGNIMNTLRLVLVGGSFGPDLFTIVELLGKDETIKRITMAIDSLPVH